MKKILSFLLAFTLIFSTILCGCNDSAKNATQGASLEGSSTDPQAPTSSESESQDPTTSTEPSATDPSSDGCSHADKDDNGSCDVCRVSLLINLDFYVINDLHGKFCDTDSQPGVDELTTFLKEKYRTDDNAILLSSGDVWQGSSESNLTNGLIMTEWMNELDFVSMTLGNHEFDWGEDAIRENETIAEFPFLAINIYDRDTDQRVEYCEPSVMIERNGIQIGIIGAIGDCYSSIAPDWTKGIYFQTGNDLTELVMDESERLRAAGADLIVYSLHDGYGGYDYGNSVSDDEMKYYYDSVLSDGYVDLVFEAHTHKYYLKQDKHDVYHLQGGGENDGIIHADVNVNYLTGTPTVVAVNFISSEEYSTYSDDPIVNTLLEKYDEQVSAGNEVLGYNSSYKNSRTLCKLGAALYYQFGTERWGDEYDIVLGGGFFSARSPYDLQAGNVSYSQLQMIFPFDNNLVLCSIKGKDLKDKFFETDNDRYYISFGEYGSNVKNNIDPDGTYYVVVDTYTSTYAPNNLTEIERYNQPVYLRDLLADYIKAGNMA